MPGKRKRVEDTSLSILENGRKSLSAIAAARLKAEAAAKTLPTLEVAHPPDIPLHDLEPRSENLDPQEDKSQDEEIEEDEELESDVHVERSFKLCNWQYDSKDILSDTHSELTIQLKKHTTIALIGYFKFTVLKGAVHILGANISAIGPAGQKKTAYHVYVPATHPVLQIRGLDGLNRVQFDTCKEPLPFTRINPLFTNIWQAESNDVKSRSFSIITDSSEDLLSRPLIAESSPELWLQAIEDCTTRPSSVLITGSTGSGKTTLARRILNRFLTGMGKSAPSISTVAYLDLDPRKQEYAPNGQISLLAIRDLNLGPAFTHPSANMLIGGCKTNEVIRAHPIPTNLADYMEYYHACIDDLFLAYQHMRSSDSSLPLIIDIPGFLYDSNFDLLARLLSRIKPEHIVHLENQPNLETVSMATKLSSLQAVSTQHRSSFHHVTAHTPRLISFRTATELEVMQMQSYFHLKSSDPRNLLWTPTPLSHLTPWEFCYQETTDRHQDFVGFAMYTSAIEPTSLIHALNGSIVHIIQSTSSRIPAPYTSLSRDSKHHLPYFPETKSIGMVEPLDPRTSRSVCTAMIRGFDLARKMVQILVPATHQNLLYNLVPEQTVFVYGCGEAPEWAYVEDVYARAATESSASPKAKGQSGDLAPWVRGVNATLGRMGYLNTRRRVRKFQT